MSASTFPPGSVSPVLGTCQTLREYAQAKQKGGRSVTTSILYPPGGSFVFPFIDPPTMRPRLASLIQTHVVGAILFIRVFKL